MVTNTSCLINPQHEAIKPRLGAVPKAPGPASHHAFQTTVAADACALACSPALAGLGPPPRCASPAGAETRLPSGGGGGGEAGTGMAACVVVNQSQGRNDIPGISPDSHRDPVLLAEISAYVQRDGSGLILPQIYIRLMVHM